MKVTGFSFIKNALIYDYPIVEAIQSILPLCDEFVVAVGKSDDDTLALIKNIPGDKIRILETEWDENLREGGRVLAEETNKALRAISADTDWAFYIQGDEVVHEKYLENIRKGMVKYQNHAAVDGLLFDYLHFYGSYDYIGASSKWYEHEIRIVRNIPAIYSYGDAMGFRKTGNQKLGVKKVDAYVYHYGWVKDPRAMQRKQQNFNKYWHNDQWIDDHVAKAEAFDYHENLEALRPFDGTHPEVMKNRIAAMNWKFDYDISFEKFSWKEKGKRFLKNQLGLDFYYKNYRIL